jgi:Spy/CpxP family protein refolding chaperone
MKNWKAVVGALLVFLLGMAAGVLGTVGMARHRWMHRGSRVVADLVVRRLSWELRLDRTQRSQLRAIVNEGWVEMKAVREQARPQVEGILSNSETKVRLILRPDQQGEFDKLIAERKAKQAQSKDG